MNEHKKKLIERALKFAYLCAGEGIYFPEYDWGDPAEFLFEYSRMTNDEDWETLHQRIFDEETKS